MKAKNEFTDNISCRPTVPNRKEFRSVLMAMKRGEEDSGRQKQPTMFSFHAHCWQKKIYTQPHNGMQRDELWNNTLPYPQWTDVKANTACKIVFLPWSTPLSSVHSNTLPNINRVRQLELDSHCICPGFISLPRHRSFSLSDFVVFDVLSRQMKV
jgi:hypothetical protein